MFSSTMLMIALALPAAETSDHSEQIVPFLLEGKLSEAKGDLEKHLSTQPADAGAHYALGTVEMLRAVERLAQNLHRFGLRRTPIQMPFLRLPVPQNPNPEEFTYDGWRQMLQQFNDDLSVAAAALEKVTEDDVKLTVPIGMIRLDLNGDGKAEDAETFWKVFAAVAGGRPSEEQSRFTISFDKADVHWMIGYTHLLRATTQTWLAYDMKVFFQFTAPFFFDGAKKEEGALLQGGTGVPFDFNSIADAVAVIHLIHFPIAEPERMRQAHSHLLAVVAQSRLCWKHALAETDNDREWIPNAKQTSPMPMAVNEGTIRGWHAFLDETEAVLEGKILLPHWRIRDGRGINLKKVFEQPRDFDLVLWVHGAAATYYLEKGELLHPQEARDLANSFQGRFLAFAIWFN